MDNFISYKILSFIGINKDLGPTSAQFVVYRPLAFSFSKMAASENDAAQSTKNIGSTSDELNNRTQVAEYVFEKDDNYSEEQDDKEHSEDGEDSRGYSSPREAEEETAPAIEQRLHPNMARDLKVPKYERALMAPSPARKRKAKMPMKGGMNKKHDPSLNPVLK